MRRAGFKRVAHGAYRRHREGLGPEEAFRRDMETVAVVLPAGAVFTHVTGARLLGWRLPHLPDHVPVFAAVRSTCHLSRPGVVLSRLTHEAPVQYAHGLPVDSAEEILLRCAREFGVLDLVIMIDSAWKCGDLDVDRLEELLATSRPGVRKLREAYALSNAKSDSAGESVLRAFHEVMDVAVDPQVELRDEQGRLVAVADLVVRGTSNVHEYDGAHHRSGQQQTTDLRRARGLTETPFVRRGYVLDDLLNHPAVLMHELDRLLARPHRRSRLTRWRYLVAESLYSPDGQARIVNRWSRTLSGGGWRLSA